jgi:hypothetical protein
MKFIEYSTKKQKFHPLLLSTEKIWATKDIFGNYYAAVAENTANFSATTCKPTLLFH